MATKMVTKKGPPRRRSNRFQKRRAEAILANRAREDVMEALRGPCPHGRPPRDCTTCMLIKLGREALGYLLR